MKMFALVDIGERAGMGIPDFMRTWAAYTESTPSYQITQNPARTTLVVPYSQAVLQKAGQQLSKIMGQSTSETSQSTPKSTQKGGQSTSDTTQSTQKSTQKGWQSTSETAQSTPKSTKKGGQSTSEGKLSAATVAILEIIRQNPRVTYEEIAATTGKARSGIAKHIKKLQEKGFLKPKDKQGLWTVVGVAKKEA